MTHIFDENHLKKCLFTGAMSLLKIGSQYTKQELKNIETGERVKEIVINTFDDIKVDWDTFSNDSTDGASNCQSGAKLVIAERNTRALHRRGIVHSHSKMFQHIVEEFARYDTLKKVISEAYSLSRSHVTKQQLITFTMAYADYDKRLRKDINIRFLSIREPLSAFLDTINAVLVLCDEL